MPLKLSIDGHDVDQLAAIHAPGLVPHMAIPSSVPIVPSNSSYPSALTPPADSPLPAKPNPMDFYGPKSGREKFEAGRPTVTEAEGTPGFYRQELAKRDYEKEHPWGSPQSEHPGFIGKVGHVLARVGNIAGDVLDPAAMSLIPGTDLYKSAARHNAERGLEAATGREQGQNKLDIEQQQADTAKEAVEQKPDLLEASGEAKGRLEVQKEAEQAKRQEALLNSQEDRADKRNESVETGRKESDQRARDLATQREEGENKRLGIREAGENARAAEKKNKPTADEQRRADLAENLNENLNTLEDIAKRRPDLFGPMAGRLTQLRGAIGTGDKDIATLETIKHQIGMAQISAHGMRSAHGIEAAADSILNNLHNQPDAVLANVQAVRNSIKTFTDDVARAKGEAPTETKVPAEPAPKTADEWLKGKRVNP